MNDSADRRAALCRDEPRSPSKTTDKDLSGHLPKEDTQTPTDPRKCTQRHVTRAHGDTPHTQQGGGETTETRARDGASVGPDAGTPEPRTWPVRTRIRAAPWETHGHSRKRFRPSERTQGRGDKDSDRRLHRSVRREAHSTQCPAADGQTQGRGGRQSSAVGRGQHHSYSEDFARKHHAERSKPDPRGHGS